MTDAYPQVTEVVCMDREKGIYAVSFIPAEGAKPVEWGILADDELHAFQRIRQEYARRRKRKRKRVSPTMSYAYQWGPKREGMEFYNVGEARERNMSDVLIQSILRVWASRQREQRYEK